MDIEYIKQNLDLLITNLDNANNIVYQAFSDAFYEKALTTIQYLHKKVHTGDVYQIARFAESLTDNSEINILFKNGENEFHYLPETQNIGTATLQIFRTPTTTNNGTALTIYTYNDALIKTPSFTAFHSPTISYNGTLINIDHSVSPNTNQVKSVGSLRAGFEFIFKENTNYLIKVTNISGATSTASCLKIEGYEEE